MLPANYIDQLPPSLLATLHPLVPASIWFYAQTPPGGASPFTPLPPFIPCTQPPTLAILPNETRPIIHTITMRFDWVYVCVCVCVNKCRSSRWPCRSEPTSPSGRLATVWLGFLSSSTPPGAFGHQSTFGKMAAINFSDIFSYRQ